MLYYILNEDGSIRSTADAMEWGRWYGNHDARRVDDTEVDELRVSTVFLGLDHNWFGSGPPILFETMVFGADANATPGADLLFCRRYATKAAAEAGHSLIVTAVRERGAAALFDLEVTP
jgi:hypothetical protein